MAKKKSVAGKRTVKKEEKKPTVVHTKRKEIVDKDGWTHVVDAPSRKPQGKSGKGVKTSSLLHAGDFEINGVSYVTRTLEEMKMEFEYWRRGWEGTSACKELRRLLGEGKGKKVGDVMFLGMGSLQSSRREGRRASATQLAALQTIIQILGQGELKVTLQDPQFTKLDKEFLTGLGYTVVEDPEAFKGIGQETLVYAVHCYADVYQNVGEGPRPAMLVGTDAENFGRFNLSEKMDAISKSLEQMVEGCESFDFPQVRHDFSDTKIYWRKESQSPKSVTSKICEPANSAAGEADTRKSDFREDTGKDETAKPETTNSEATQPDHEKLKTASTEELETTQPETAIETLESQTTTAESAQSELGKLAIKASEIAQAKISETGGMQPETTEQETIAS